MFCTKCGAELPDDAVFCTSCGEKTEYEENPGKGKALTIQRKITKKGIKAAIAAVFLFAAVGLILWTTVYNRPKNVVVRGLENTWEAVLQEESGLNEYLGLKKLKKSLDSDTTRQTFGMEASIPFLFDDKLSITGQLDKDGKKRSALIVKGNVPVGGNNILDVLEARLYRDDEKILLSLPGLYQQNFCLNLSELREKLDNPLFRAQLEEEYGIVLSGDLKIDQKNLFDEYWKISGENWKNLYKNMNVTKLEKRNFTIGTKNRACRGYEVVIPKGDIRFVLGDLSELLVKKVSPVITSAVGTEYGEAERKEAEYFMRSFSDKLVDAIGKDLKLQVYIGPKGRLVSVEGSMDLNIRIGTVSFEGKLALTGAKNPLDSIDVQAEGNVLKFGRCSFNLKRKMTDSEGSVEDNLKTDFSVSMARVLSVKGAAELEANLDKNTGEWDMEAKLSLPALNSSASAKGSCENVTKGKSFEVILEDVEIGAYGLNVGAADINAHYGISLLKESFSDGMDDRRQLDILKLTPGEWEAIGDSVEEHLEGRNSFD